MKHLWLVTLLVSSCSFTTGTAFKECDTDVQCGSAKACSRGYCLPLPDGCRAFEGVFDKADVVRFVAFAPLSVRRDGGISALELNGLNGMATAVREVNGQRINGKGLTVALFVCDTFSDEKNATAQVEWAIAEMKMPGLITSGNTTTLLAAQNPTRNDAGTVIMSPNATALGLIELFQRDHATFRIAPPDSMQASVLAQLMTGDSQYIAQARVAVIYEEGDDRAQFAATLKNRLLDAGRTSEMFAYTNPINPISLIALMSRDLKPTASVALGSPTQLRALVTEGAKSPSIDRASGHRWLFSGTAKDPVLLASPAVSTELEGMLGVAPTQGIGSLATAFRSDFVSTYGTEPITAPAAHDAMFMLILSSQWGSTSTSDVSAAKLSAGLSNLSAPGASLIQLNSQSTNAAVTELSAKRPISVDGVTGKLVLDPDAGAPSTAFEVWRVQDAGFTTVRFATP